MGDRAEGFWWVRVPGGRHAGETVGPRWVVAEVRPPRRTRPCFPPLFLYWGGSSAGMSYPLEWGPYLGKEPAGASAAQALPDRWMCEHKRREPHYYSAKDYCLDCCSYIEPDSRLEGAS